MLRIVWKNHLIGFIQVIDHSNLMAFIWFVSFVLSVESLFCKTTWYLGFAKIYWMLALPTKWLQSMVYARKLVYSHDVTDINDNFHFLDIAEKLPPALLRIAVTLLNKYLNLNITTNNLFINIEIWSIFLKLLYNSALKYTIFSTLWRNVVFQDQGLFFWLFFSFCLSLVL